jgi:hypothetical protein
MRTKITSTTKRAGGMIQAAVEIPSMWMCGFTHSEMKRTGCTYREAIVAAVEQWQEQGRLAAQFKAGN